jgi:phosphoribosylformimino-5-aminoimidazole carboxamide ribotide isomerase
MQTMAILPVLDLMQGLVVRGVAGRREEYRPIVSRLVHSAEPLAVARAFRDQFGLGEIYLADLDAIQHGVPQLAIYKRLCESDFRLWIDAGIRTSGDDVLAPLMEMGTSVVVGLESVAGPVELQEIVARVGAGNIVFSLDLKAGQPLGRTGLWPNPDAWSIAAHAITALGVRRLIVLDLSRVGVGAGVGTDEICGRLKQAFPKVEITAGGGVREMADVNRLTSIGVDRVLVASALHDGRLTPADLTAR